MEGLGKAKIKVSDLEAAELSGSPRASDGFTCVSDEVSARTTASCSAESLRQPCGQLLSLVIIQSCI